MRQRYLVTYGCAYSVFQKQNNPTTHSGRESNYSYSLEDLYFSVITRRTGYTRTVSGVKYLKYKVRISKKGIHSIYHWEL